MDFGPPLDGTITPDGGFGIRLRKGSRQALELTWNGGQVVVEVRVAAGDRRDVAIRVGAARLEGRILDAEGRPIAGASIRAGLHEGLGEILAGRQANSGADGAWVLDHLPAGKQPIHAFPPRGPERDGEARWETVSLAPGECRVLELDVVATDVRSRGRLRLRDRRPLPRPGHVSLADGASRRRASYDAAGRFQIAAPPGTHRWGVSPRGPRREFSFEFPPEIRPAATPPPAPDLLVLRTDVEAEVTLVGGLVPGRLLDFGRPNEVGTFVAFHPAPAESIASDADRESILDVLTDSHCFRTVALPPGRYVVGAMRSGRWIELARSDGLPAAIDVPYGSEIPGLALRERAR